jgi:hypothetical protein
VVLAFALALALAASPLQEDGAAEFVSSFLSDSVASDGAGEESAPLPENPSSDLSENDAASLLRPEMHGFIQVNATARTTGEPHATGDWSLAEVRARLSLDGGADAVSYRVQLEAARDEATSEDLVGLHEAWIAYRPGSWDLRLGRQIATWGTGDLLFVNDLFPKDWTALFLGRPVEYLKRPFTALRAGRSDEVSLGSLSFDLVAAPLHKEDRLPDPTRFVLSDPFGGAPRRMIDPGREIDDLEVSGRLRLEREGTEWALYGYRGRARSFAERPDAWAAPTLVTRFYPRLSTYGVSVTTPLGPGIFSIEAGRHESRDDRNGIDPAIDNSSLRGLVGYRFDPFQDFSVGAQYYVESMENYSAYQVTSPAGFPARPRYRDLAAIRLTRWLRQQTLKLDLFAAYSPKEGDAWIMPEARFEISDGVWISGGATIFSGKAATPFGALGRNDNLHATVRYEF